MSFQERERLRLISEGDRIFKDPGFGMFSGIPREIVLSDPAANLWEGIRDDAIEYFARNRISWWGEEGNEPTGHMLSPQIACLNHLYAIRRRPDLANAVLRAIDAEVLEAEAVDDGYVEFEFIGEHSYLGESPFSRGRHCTSIDAFMIGRVLGGGPRAFLIEWNYAEACRSEDKYNEASAGRYDNLITAEKSPFVKIEPRALYFEPFYQLTRQTLLGWQITEHKDHGCTSYRHVHVVPEANEEVYRDVNSPGLKGGECVRGMDGGPQAAWPLYRHHPGQVHAASCQSAGYHGADQLFAATLLVRQ